MKSIGGKVNKICTKCKKIKPIEKFSSDRSKKSGRSWCKLCDNLHKRGKIHNIKTRFSKYKNGAKIRKLPFELSFDEFKNITKKSCTYCGEYSESLNETFCGIDRIDPNKGYIKDNIVPCCWPCNYMKGVSNIQEFCDRIEKIYKIINQK